MTFLCDASAAQSGTDELHYITTLTNHTKLCVLCVQRHMTFLCDALYVSCQMFSEYSLVLYEPSGVK